MQKSPPSVSSVLIPAAIALAVGAAVFTQQQNSTGFQTLLNIEPATTKPFSTFAEFYPHYLKEHSLPDTRRMHFVGTTLILIVGIVQPATFLAFFTALATGFALFPLTRSVPHGLYEAAAMIAAFIFVSRPLNGSWAKTLLPCVKRCIITLSLYC